MTAVHPIAMLPEAYGCDRLEDDDGVPGVGEAKESHPSSFWHWNPNGNHILWVGTRFIRKNILYHNF